MVINDYHCHCDIDFCRFVVLNNQSNPKLVAKHVIAPLGQVQKRLIARLFCFQIRELILVLPATTIDSSVQSLPLEDAFFYLCCAHVFNCVFNCS